MKDGTRAFFEKLLADSVKTASDSYAAELRAQARGMISALLAEDVLSPKAYVSNLVLVDLAAAQRAEQKETM